MWWGVVIRAIKLGLRKWILSGFHKFWCKFILLKSLKLIYFITTKSLLFLFQTISYQIHPKFLLSIINFPLFHSIYLFPLSSFKFTSFFIYFFTAFSLFFQSRSSSFNKFSSLIMQIEWYCHFLKFIGKTYKVRLFMKS